MKFVLITLPDGTQKRYEAGVTAQTIAREISPRLEDAAVAAKINGKVVDLVTPIEQDAAVVIITKQTPEGLDVIRHSTAHLLAMAVKELYPETQVTIGPVTEDGFYYDFDRETQFTPDDLPKIEKKMTEIASRKLTVTREEHTKDGAVLMFKNMHEHFKVEIIKDLKDPVFSTYRQGDWVDLCRGPHVNNTSKLGKFKLLSIAGAYWRGDEKNKMLQRIYGTAFATQKELDEYLTRLEEAKKRDHRKLGPELGLFTFLPVAPAMPFFLPKGALLLDLMASHIRAEMRPEGYNEVVCPQLMNTSLWKTSGHMDNYKENMYFATGGEDGIPMALKPMNCPGHAALYASGRHSYRDLPLRYAEFSKLHRYERAGATHGLMRTRTFSQDDAHIFCTEDQIQAETLANIRHTYKVYQQFGFTDVAVKLATRPEKYAGTIENWEKATKALAASLDHAGVPFTYLEGEGAFYGPKIEFHIRDSIGRMWQCGTIQVDFSTPDRFGLEYYDSESKVQRPVMIHRAILGSFERFMGILVEHHAGHLPLWISPVQIALINVAEDQEGYVKGVAETLSKWGLRVETDLRREKLGYKIREAQLKKTPLMGVLGPKEMENQTLSVRDHSGQTTNDLTLDAFKAILEEKLKPGGMTH